jgi:transposase
MDVPGCQGCATLGELVEQLRAEVGQFRVELATTKSELAATKSELAATKSELTATKSELAATKAKLAAAQKDSSNSSKPPSSDFVKKPKDKPKDGKKRQRGAQPGHPRHEHQPFAEEDVNYTELRCLECPDCHGPIVPSKQPPKVVQQVDLHLPSEMISVVGFRSHACWCRKCRQVHYAPIDEATRRAGLIGPRLTTLVAYLKSACHCSYSTIRKFIRDVLGITVSRGYLVKLINKTSASLQAAYAELAERLPNEARLNVDETGHKDYRTSMWTWCFRASLFTLFKISPSRGSEVLVETLGKEFNGILGCDYFSAYRKYMKDFGVLVQFCLAHFLRDVRFLVEHPNGRNQAYGQRVLERLRALFAVIHGRELSTHKAFQTALQNAGDELHAEIVWRVPNTKEARNLAKRFEKHGDSYLRFITTPGIEPTNNLAEQAIRFVVIDRKVTQGTRGDKGQRWLERIWTVLATCAQTGRNVFTFLHQSLSAFFAGQATPRLLPDSS